MDLTKKNVNAIFSRPSTALYGICKDFSFSFKQFSYKILLTWIQNSSYEISNFQKYVKVIFFFTPLCLFCRVNKPYLPIAAGDLSVQSAWLLVIFFAVAGVLIVGLNFGPFITSLYCLGLFLGTIYSVPPLRFKRFPVVAFLIIATV